MLETPVPLSNYPLPVKKKSGSHTTLFDLDQEEDADIDIHSQSNGAVMPETYDDDDDLDMASGGGKERGKSRRELPAGAVATLKAWLLSPEHFTHPYPTPQDQAMLMQKTGIDKKQLKNWFTNARRRIWKPMLKKQIEQGNLTSTGVQGIPGSVPGLMMPNMPGGASAGTSGLGNPHSIQAMRTHYQQAVGQTQQQQQQQQQQQHQQQAVDAYGNPVYNQGMEQHPGKYYTQAPQPPQQQHEMAQSTSIGTLPQLLSSKSLNKTDSHAVLMELFARDQDLVRQATESARLKSDSHPNLQQQHLAAQHGMAPSQHPMKGPSQNVSSNVPTMNSWPHFSSVTSLNNLGTMPGVKSITSLSGADLASKGTVNKMGNLAQVKSMESMGKNDSYAFLEVFFGDRSSISLSGMGGRDQGNSRMKHNPEEDNEIGLSLEDETPSQPMGKDDFAAPAPMTNASQPAPVPTMSQDGSTMESSNTLKRAYDDALAARGLISVSRSCERLTDLALPSKIQRTLSQEFIRKQQSPQEELDSNSFSYGEYVHTSNPGTDQHMSFQYPGQQPVEPHGLQSQPYNPHHTSVFSSDPSEADGHVQVPSETKCALCSQTNVDTQLRPCGHMFHERCLKPSLQTPMGPPKCPCDDIPMQSALLAIPTPGVTHPPLPQDTHHPAWSYPSSQSLPTQNQGV